MTDGDASLQFGMPSFLTRPSHEEVVRLHRELQVWMMHTRYTVQGVDNQPLWRMHNTSLTLGTGAGIGAYLAVAKIMPKLQPLVRAVPATVFFYITYRAIQIQQLPYFYTSLLTLPTPLGGKGREVLTALRNGGLLPSQEFANQMPPPPATAGAAAGPPASEASERSPVFFAGDDQAPPPRVSSLEPAPTPVADPWGADAGFGGSGVGGEATGFGDAWPAEQAKAPAKTRATWDEIRARQAAAAASPERR